MDARILVGTESGLFKLRGDTLEPVEKLAARDVTALAREAGRTWGIVDGRSLWSGHDGHGWEEHAAIAGPDATCLAPTTSGLLITHTAMECQAPVSSGRRRPRYGTLHRSTLAPMTESSAGRNVSP